MGLRDTRHETKRHETCGNEKSLTSHVHKSRVNRLYKVITIVVVVITLVLAVYIMVHRLGVVEDYDFGAGAYYYADIPTEEYSEIDKGGAYTNAVPKWIYYVLFFAWGWLMWRLWVWIDGRNEGQKK